MPRRPGSGRFDVPTGVAPEDEYAIWAAVVPRLVADLKRFDPSIDGAAVHDNDPPTGDAHIELWNDGGGLTIDSEVTEDVEAVLITATLSVLDSGFFENVTRPWPTCPFEDGHSPVGGPHSLVPARRPGRAMWVCPHTGRAYVQLGQLP